MVTPAGVDPVLWQQAAEIGFTGTRHGASADQLARLEARLTDLFEPGAKFHHGDCVGADAQAHAIARRLGYWIIGHPPKDDVLRAWCDCDELRDPAPYVIRDGCIVRECHRLLATPDEPERRHSGTWTTVRIARSLDRPYEVIAP